MERAIVKLGVVIKAATRTFANTTTQTQKTIKRAPKALTRTQSINSGSTLNDEKNEALPAANSATQDRVSRSLVGSNVHGTYNAQRERTLWMKKPLFARPGDSGFSSGKEATDKLEAEALRRDPYQVDFLESLRDVTRAITPLIEQSPKLAWVMKQLMEPERFVTFRVSWKDDDNNWRMNRGYCINYSSALGPFKGPVRFDHRLTHGALRMLGFEEVLKHALVRGESWGGSTGGADLDVSNKSPEELRRFSQAFLRALGETVGQKTDVLHTMSDIEVPTGIFAAAVVAEASSLVFGANKLNNVKCALSGSGKLTLTLAKHLSKAGALPISFSDNTGFLIDQDGFDIDAIDSLERLLVNNGRLEDFRHVSKTCMFHAADKGSSLWEAAKAEVAIPAVSHAELSADDAAALAESGCKAVFEAADRACSENAVRVLRDRKVMFGPSKMILAVPLQAENMVDSTASSLVEDVIQAAQEANFAASDLQAGACIIAFKRLSEAEMFKI